MRLNKEDYHQFLRLHQPLLLFAGIQKGLLPENMTIEQWRYETDFETKHECRMALYENPELIDELVKANTGHLPDQDLEIMKKFRHFVSGDFFIFKYLKNYAVFIQDDIAYGVLALSDPFSKVVGDDLPIYVDAVLLPFKDQIVYDGIIISRNIRFGWGYRDSLNEIYKEANAKYGIVLSLPFEGEPAYAGMNLEERLKYFMKNKNNREIFAADIEHLVEHHPDLLPLYHQEWGKVDARRYKKQFADLELKKAYYAILQGQLFCSAPKKAKLEEVVKAIVPKRKRDWVYYFRM